MISHSFTAHHASRSHFFIHEITSAAEAFYFRKGGLFNQPPRGSGADAAETQLLDALAADGKRVPDDLTDSLSDDAVLSAVNVQGAIRELWHAPRASPSVTPAMQMF